MTASADALAYARYQACWGMATLEVVAMTEGERLMELIRTRADALHESCMPDEELLVGTYPMPKRKATK